MENFIQEGKSGFDFASVSSSSKLVNANRLLVHALAYNLFNYTSIGQRAAQGYLDLFPQFIPDEQAPVSASEQKEFQLNGRQKAILARLGTENLAKLPLAWVWMAEKEHLGRFQFPSRFAHCCFRDDYIYAAGIYEKAFGNEAFYRLTGWMGDHGYRLFDIYDTTASNCKFSLTYANPVWSEESPRGGFEYKIKHTGISLRHEPYCKEPWILGVCIPGGMKLYLEHFAEMPSSVQDFVMSRVKRCDGCGYCVQTDKSGKRPFARIPIQYMGSGYSLCPYFPGYSFWWSSMDNALADNIIGLLGFMDRFAHNKNLKLPTSKMGFAP